MNRLLTDLKNKVYDQCSLQVTGYRDEPESKEYDACRFKLNGLSIICRSAKVAPKKTGQFVTFWKRKDNGPIEPFHETDAFDFYMVNVEYEGKLGQFVFPKSVLIKKGMVSTDAKEGKRAIRVYPPWDEVKSEQAKQTQKWQLEYFLNINRLPDLERVMEFYSNKTIINRLSVVLLLSLLINV
ncbi:MepB family protein [Fulvivirga ulvae]|uniref:MepB family protein n=1 Tax=Fulvivirga ulvae TaxID=2904245 RepID=UPI001F22FEF5|nr:MepB family protein [Fulvivirga ulvae]UII32571.1 MepB family protein [Fulvivirga ulvae]